MQLAPNSKDNHLFNPNFCYRSEKSRDTPGVSQTDGGVSDSKGDEGAYKEKEIEVSLLENFARL